MSKSRFKKTKLASVLLLSTVLLPNIAYAEEQGDDVETEVNSEEQVYIEEDQSTFDDNTNINMSAQNEREPVEDDGEDGGSLLEPADPVEPGEDTEDIINDNEDESADVVEGPEGEEETPGATPETTDPEPADPEPDEEESDIPEIPEVPTDPIDPVEPDPEPEVPEEPTQPEQPVEPEEPVDPPYEPQPELENPEPEVPVEPELSDDGGNEEDVEETETSTEEETMGTGSGPKKIYRYNHGDILNGIKFDYNNIEDDMATLDQRVTRIMSSQIIEEKDLTEAQKLELEEEVKETTPHGAEELPDTGEANIPNYARIGMLSIIGGMLLLLSRKLKTDN